MATGTILPKVKVKEEAKEGRGYRQPPSTPASPSTSNSSVGSGSGGSSSSSSGGESSGAASATTSVAASASSSPTARGVPPQQASGVGGRPAIAPPPSVQPAADPVPVDLEPKSKANASVPAGRESAPRDDARPDSPGRRADTDSPAAAPCPAAKPEPEEPEDGAASLSAAAIAGVFAGHGELKSVLGTVVKFATAISPDTGDTVLTLVLALLSGAMTAEEFHSALQEATNYTLKGFVLPHLKQQLPSLQRDLSGAARASSQSCAQFLRSNEAAVLEAVGLLSTAPSESIELFGERAGGGGGGGGGNQAPAPYAARSASNPSSTATAGLHRFSAGPSSAPKRRPSDTPYYENGAVLSDDVPVYGKRLSSPWSQHHPSQQQQQSTESGSPYCWYHPVPSASGSIQGHGHRPAPMAAGSVQMNQSSPFAGSHHAAQQQHGHGQPPPSASLDDEWKNIHMMLNCILGMVEKTKKALAILQSRGGLGAAATATVPVSPLQPPSGLPAQNGAAVQAESSSGGDREGSLKRLSGEIVAQTIRAIEDKVAEAKRKDEEAVKRAVMAEVQRAVRVAVAESRASERLRIHRLLDVSLPRRSSAPVRQGTGAAYLRGHGNPPASLDATARPTAAASTSEDEKDSHPRIVSGSSCWNCGRPALETCGGCGIARYCGSFCQHRDWESGGHHATCGSPGSRELRRSASRSPPRVASASASDASVAPIPAALATKGK